MWGGNVRKIMIINLHRKYPTKFCIPVTWGRSPHFSSMRNSCIISSKLSCRSSSTILLSVTDSRMDNILARISNITRNWNYSEKLGITGGCGKAQKWHDNALLFLSELTVYISRILFFKLANIPRVNIAISFNPMNIVSFISGVKDISRTWANMKTEVIINAKANTTRNTPIIWMKKIKRIYCHNSKCE